MALNKTLPGLALPRVQGGTLDPKMTEPPPPPLRPKHPSSQSALFFHFSALFCFPASLASAADFFSTSIMEACAQGLVT